LHILCCAPKITGKCHFKFKIIKCYNRGSTLALLNFKSSKIITFRSECKLFVNSPIVP
jgi:hypothetical protein